MNSKELSKIKTDLRGLLRDPGILDVILFGSSIKGKHNPSDIDIAVISEKQAPSQKEPYHISNINPREFALDPPMLANILLREGYSLRRNKPFAQRFHFTSKILFTYDLRDLSPSKKVKIVNILRGKNGLVAQCKGEWIARQVFLAPIENDKVFEDLFLAHGIKFKRSFLLIH